jgi:hypothetical protein
MTRADLNNDRGYLLGYARLMLAQARRSTKPALKSLWLNAAHNARARAEAVSAPVQGEMFS